MPGVSIRARGTLLAGENRTTPRETGRGLGLDSDGQHACAGEGAGACGVGVGAFDRDGTEGKRQKRCAHEQGL